MASNIQLQNVVDHVYTLVRGAPLQDVLGVQGEPALGICNDTYQFALQRPLTWRFNKANAGLSGAILANGSTAQWTNLGVLYFTTVQYQQDYPLTNATANVPPTSGGSNPGGGQVHIPTVYNSGLVVAGGVATVTTNWAHSFSPGQSVTMQNVGQWQTNTDGTGTFVADTSGNINATFTIATCPTTTSFTFATGATTGTYGAPGINDIGWIERAVLEDWACNSTVKPRHSIEVTMNLELESIIQPPFKISYQLSVADKGTATNAAIPSNTAIFRLWPVPSSQIWGVMIDYQMKPGTFVSLSDTWGVWPDELISVIRKGVKCFALDFVEDPRVQTAYADFQNALQEVQNIRDQERPSQSFFPSTPIQFGG